MVEIVPIYFFPAVEQRGLLYQALFFHEFAHLLYRCHEREMDDLIREFQGEIGKILTPPAQRNDRQAQVQAGRRQLIAVRWFTWVQEFFCDAVGLIIGGPCFLRAFSEHLGTMDRGDFYKEPEDLTRSTHPVTWLRVKLLVQRAAAGGLVDVAREVDEHWRQVAGTMLVKEDYHGFYDNAFHSALVRTLDDMVAEADPRPCSSEETNSERPSSRDDPLPAVLNAAWKSYLRNSGRYPDWESEMKQVLLS